MGLGLRGAGSDWACAEFRYAIAARLGVTHFLTFDGAQAAVAAKVLVGVQVFG